MSDLRDLDEKINKIFYSVVSLNESYLCHYIETTYDESQVTVDLDSSRNLFRIIINTENDGTMQLFAKRFLKISEELVSHHSQRDEKKENFLNIFIIGMETIHFFTKNSLKLSRMNIALAIGFLPLKTQKVLMNYWKNQSGDWFRRVIAEIKEFIAGRYLSSSFYLERNLNLLLILKGIYSVLFFANVADDKQIDEIISREPIKSLEIILPSFRIISSPKIPLKEFQIIENGESSFNKIFENPEETSLWHFSFALTPELKYGTMQQLIYSFQDTKNVLDLRISREGLLQTFIFYFEDEGFRTRLKCPIEVEFFGEMAEDTGGVAREFFRLIFQEIFDPKTKLFLETPQNQYAWFNCQYGDCQMFYYVGILMGIAFLNNIQIHLPLPKVFFYKLLGHPGNFYDLFDFDKTLANSLLDVIQYEKEDLKDVFTLNFVAAINDEVHELEPNGLNTPVTQANKVEYVEKYADMILNSSVEKQFSQLRKGFFNVAKEIFVQPYFRHADDLQSFMCGEGFIDVDAIQSSASYEDYIEHSPTIQMFWSVMRELSQEQLKNFLIYITGSDRFPPCGLQMKIQRNGSDSDLLPFVSTCSFVLFLPEYSTRDKLKERLLLALSHASGFGAV